MQHSIRNTSQHFSTSWPHTPMMCALLMTEDGREAGHDREHDGLQTACARCCLILLLFSPLPLGTLPSPSLLTRACMRACVRACVRVCVRVRVRVRVRVHVCVRARMRACVRACVDGCICACLHLCVFAFVHVCLSVSLYLFLSFL